MSQPSPDTWRPRQLTAWLEANGLRELEQNLREQGFKTVVDIVESNLTDADLRSLGIEHMKVRKDVLRALANEAKLHIYNMGAYHRMHAAANMLVEPLVALAPKAEAAPAASPVSCWKKWPENFARLAAYKNKHGDCNVPRHWPEDPQLGDWVRRQRKRKRKMNRGELKGKNHRVDPDFGSALTVSNRDSQSNCWANWKIMGQPCEFQVLPSPSSTRRAPLPRSPRRRPRT